MGRNTEEEIAEEKRLGPAIVAMLRTYLGSRSPTGLEETVLTTLTSAFISAKSSEIYALRGQEASLALTIMLQVRNFTYRM